MVSYFKKYDVWFLTTEVGMQEMMHKVPAVSYWALLTPP